MFILQWYRVNDLLLTIYTEKLKEILSHCPYLGLSITASSYFIGIDESQYDISGLSYLARGGPDQSLGRGVRAPAPQGYRNEGAYPAGLNAHNCPNYPYCYWIP